MAYRKEEQVSALASRSEHQQGAIRVDRETDHILAVCLKRDFDRTNQSELNDQIHQGLDRGYHLILDLSETTFIDSSIISVLARAARSAGRREQGMVMQLRSATTVERVLEIARIEHLLPRAHDRRDAVALIDQHPDTPLLRPI